MEEKEHLPQKLKDTAKKYINWYLYPIIYFTVTGIVCAFAWYRPHSYPQNAVKIIFKTISLVPTLSGMIIITLWIALAVLFALVSYRLKTRSPDSYLLKAFEKISFHKTSSGAETNGAGPAEAGSRRDRIFGSFIYIAGSILIIAGISLIVWVARPYVTLLLSASKIEALENKVRLGTVHDNRIIIPSILVDAPVLEGVDKGNLARGVCHIPNSSFPGGGGNCIIEGHNLAEFGLWKPQSFFSLLELVDKGTLVHVFYNGRKYLYKVGEKIYRDVNDPGLYENSSSERLTLITCVSTWSPNIYTIRRTVVIAYPDF